MPGGIFDEQYYWDSYFIMLGLRETGDYERIEDMVQNVASMLKTYRFVPTANRSYFLSRSQPPFFAAMVKLLAEHKGKRTLVAYLPSLLTEYRFWMNGRSKVGRLPDRAYRRLVELPGKVWLNRYYDDDTTPRPESHRRDVTTARDLGLGHSSQLFLDLRAGAESGWDFSSRWLIDPHDLRTIITTDIIPVDLNCLLYVLEQTIAEAYTVMHQPLLARYYSRQAQKRAQAIRRYAWDKERKFFADYRLSQRAATPTLSLAAVFPLYVGIATPQQAKHVAARLQREFLKPGGLVTTLQETDQQWDAPNGWAPLLWVAVEGLRRYGYNELAETISHRWLKLNERVYRQTHKMIEKYNVVDASGIGGGGEYPLQDGFGWTNGVYVALKRQSQREQEGARRSSRL